MTTLFHARMETRNFDFEGFGTTEAEARETLDTAILLHAKQYGIRADWAKDHDITVRRIETGMPYRDGEPMREG